MRIPEEAIRRRRQLTNQIIAAHKVERLRPFFRAAMVLVPGEGGVVTGRKAVLEAYSAQFRDPEIITYVRTPAEVRPDATGARAGERGEGKPCGSKRGVRASIWPFGGNPSAIGFSRASSS